MRQVAYGESDLIATLFTEAEGKVGALVRGGRKSSKRVGGAIEPFHTMEARLEDRGGELATLKEARIVRVRDRITANLDATMAAGTALRWVRHACPPKTREPETWRTLNELLDAIDANGPDESPRVALARGALRLLADMGYALESRSLREMRQGVPGGARGTGRPRAWRAGVCVVRRGARAAEREVARDRHRRAARRCGGHDRGRRRGDPRPGRCGDGIARGL